MLPLNAKLERFSDGEASWEQFSIPLNSNLHQFLEHSLAQSKLQMQEIVRRITSAHCDWEICHMDAFMPISQIVFIYGKCITVKKNIEKFKTFQTKKREREKIEKLWQALAPYLKELHTTIEKLQSATNNVQETLNLANDMLGVPGMNGIIFYRSWTVHCFVEFLKTMLEKFNFELERKKLLEKRIVSTMDRDELRACRSFWQHLHLTEDCESFYQLYNAFWQEIHEKKC